MRYFLGFLGIVALVVFVFILVVRGFTSHPTPKNQIDLTNYTNTATQMELTIEGPVTADQSYNEIRILVGGTSNTIDLMQGYQDKVIATQTFPNNTNAYGTFLRALQLLNFTKGNTAAAMADERGYCPGAERFVYEIVNGPDVIQRYWTGSCGVGTYKGQSGPTNTLFANQIPNYDTFISNAHVDLGL